LFKEGKAVSVFPIRIGYQLIAGTEQPGQSARTTPNLLQAGFSVSSRTFKKAVDRNRVKRLLRECYRKEKAGLFHQLAVKNIPVAIFIIFTGKELPDYKLVDEKMKLALKKLCAQLT
jgi:ribonuclease P protein component